MRMTFDFPSTDLPPGAPPHGGRLVFLDPVRVIEATTVDEVAAAVAEIEGAVAEGRWAAGYLAYEAAPAFEPGMRVRGGSGRPLLRFGVFDAPSGSTSGDGGGGEDGDHGASPLASLDWAMEPERAGYHAAIAAVREAIADGITYQVNLTARARARLGPDASSSPAAVYEALRRAQGPGYHALLELGDEVIASVSPELFFRTRGRSITTRPMKGTRPRGRWTEEDAAMAAELAGSEKDRAENLMIVDLLRNDLGRVCAAGAVRAPRLFEVERYRTVWQLTSTVEGRLRDDVALGDLLAALFPCGSVTGAPKISTMDVIARLETAPRHVYCGAIGMIAPGGDAVFSVPIRTLHWDPRTGAAEYGTGGGVVWDSTAEGEYDELRAKAVVIREPWPRFDLLETMALRDGRIDRLDCHLARLRESAAYFGFPYDDARVRAALARATADPAPGPVRIRLLLGPSGDVVVERAPLEPEPAPALVAVAERPVTATDRFLFHKTTHRGAYDERRAARPDLFDVLLHNERGEATEFTRGNLVVELNGRLVTPPRHAGLLAGCLRAELLEAGRVEEATVRVAELERATRMWFVNSARGWIPVRMERRPGGREREAAREGPVPGGGEVEGDGPAGDVTER